MIAVHITERFQIVLANASKLKKLARTVCKRFGISHAVVSIGIVDDAEMRGLNKQFLNRDANTDCLSFDLSDEAESTESRVFDLIVNGELAGREAAQRGHGAEAELALYITHGLLHNLGFDDATAEQARQMHRTEDEILQHLGYGLVYNTEVPGP